MPRIYLSPPDIRPEDHASVEDVLTSNWVAPIGPHLTEFEQQIAKATQREHAVALNSGTAALHLALQILGIGAGDNVICPTLTFAASANPICYLGAKPVFIDSEPRTWNMDPALLEQALENTASVKAVIVVHLYGQCAEMDAILTVCERHNVPVIEDAAEALGASYAGKPAGSMGDFSFFSFNGNKIITTSGGGMLLANKKALIDRALYLATQAKEPAPYYQHTCIGYNYRMSNVLAGLGISQFGDLARRIKVRREHFEHYRNVLGNILGLTFMPIQDPESANYWLTCLTIDNNIASTNRDAMLQALAERDIEARPIWKPLHLQPVFEDCDYWGEKCAEHIFDQGICLPSGSGMSITERDIVVDAVLQCV